jgi:hypothetical protein
MRRGFGQITDATQCTSFFGWLGNSDCWGHSIPYWQNVVTPGGSGIAPPPAPTGSVLTTPPANAAEAQATVNELLNQQMAAQQAADASQVQPVTDVYSLLNSATGSVLAGSSTTSSGVPWWVWVVAGGIFLVAAFGGRH